MKIDFSRSVLSWACLSQQTQDGLITCHYTPMTISLIWINPMISPLDLQSRLRSQAGHSWSGVYVCVCECQHFANAPHWVCVCVWMRCVWTRLLHPSLHLCLSKNCISVNRYTQYCGLWATRNATKQTRVFHCVIFCPLTMSTSVVRIGGRSLYFFWTFF